MEKKQKGRKKDREYLRVRNFLKVIQKVNYKNNWKPSSSHKLANSTSSVHLLVVPFIHSARHV